MRIRKKRSKEKDSQGKTGEPAGEEGGEEEEERGGRAVGEPYSL